MNYQKFVKTVQERAGLPSPAAADAASQATLQTLSERLFGGEAKDLLSQLPEPIKLSVRPMDTAVKYDPAEFVRKVSEREGVDVEQAGHHCKAVLEVLAEAVAPGEMDDVRGQLPHSFESLLPGAGTHKPPRHAGR